MQSIWIEYPVADLARAKAFYETVFGHEPTDVIDEGVRLWTMIPGSPIVSLNKADDFTAVEDGNLVYFTVEGTLTAALERVTAAGGSIVDPPAPRGENDEYGWFSRILDTEGNALYMHAAAA